MIAGETVLLQHRSMVALGQSGTLRRDESRLVLGNAWFCVTAAAVVCLLASAGPATAQERAVNISGKEIVERLSRLEEGQKRLEQRIADLERSLTQRIAEGDNSLAQRIADLEKNLDQRIVEGVANLDQRIRELRDFMLWGFGVNFAGIFALIGFVLWDRRTALAPAVRRFDELRDREQRLESALRDYAAHSPELADSLRKSGLL
jgi:predicted PurR-regulated permease PerM